MADLVVAVEGFFDSSSGTEVFVAAGQVLGSDHELVTAHPDLFRPVDPTAFTPPAKAPKRAASK